MNDTYRVHVTREGDSYVADLGEIGSTFARSLVKLDTYVREVIVLSADLPESAMADLNITWDFEDEGLAQAAEASRQLAELRRQESEQLKQVHQSMRDLIASGYSYRDVAAVTRTTSGRVSQVASPKNDTHHKAHRTRSRA